MIICTRQGLFKARPLIQQPIFYAAQLPFLFPCSIKSRKYGQHVKSAFDRKPNQVHEGSPTSKKLTAFNEKTSNILPPDLLAAIQAFEQQLQERNLNNFSETYTTVRQCVAELDRRLLNQVDKKTLPTILRSPEKILEKAMTLLTTSGLKEHALLHHEIYRDQTVVFRSSVLSDPPLQFSAKIIDQHFDRGSLDAVYAAYSHLCYLCEAFPNDLAGFDFRRVEMWMDRLFQLGEPKHIEFLCRIVSDLHQYFRVSPTRAHHHTIIKGFLIADMVSGAWKWLQHLERLQETPKATGTGWKRHLGAFSWLNKALVAKSSPDERSYRDVVELTSDEYDFFLNYFSKAGDFRSAHILMMQITKTGGNVAPNRRSWHLYLAAALASPKLDIGSIQSVLTGMEKAGHVVNLDTLCAVSGRWPIEKWVPDLQLRSISPYTRPNAQRHEEDMEEADILPEVIPLDKPQVSPQLPVSEARVLSTEKMVDDAVLGVSNSPVDIPSGISMDISSSENKHIPAFDIHNNNDADAIAHSMNVSTYGGEFGVANSPSYTNIDDHDTLIKEDCHIVSPEDDTDHYPKDAGEDDHPINDISDYKQVRRGTKLRVRIMRSSSYDASAALLAYKEYVKLLGVARPDIELADTLIKILCQSSIKPPPKANVLQAVQVYEEFVKTAAGPPEAQKAGEYINLLNVLIKSLTWIPSKKSNLENDLATEERCATEAKKLLLDMKRLGIWPDDRMLCSIILHRFHIASSHKDALASYTSFTSELEAMIPRARPDIRLKQSHWRKTAILSGSTCKAILNAFSDISFPSSPVTPARLWFSMLSDMSSRGFVVDARDYTRYLGNFRLFKMSPVAQHWEAIGMESPDGEEKRIKSLYASVKYIHRQLSIDINVVPDAALLNTLMNAYQHLGAFDDALKVFNTIWVTNRMNSVTPVIAFDACSHARRAQEAVIIWDMLVRRGWKFDKKTLDTWVECLCRLGDVSAACKFVCLTMGKDDAGYNTQGNTRPDENTCAILLKLSWTVGQSADVKEKIRIYLPHLWHKISQSKHENT